MVLGLESVSAGEIWLEGKRWDDAPEAERQERRLGYQYIPQDAMAALDPQQTALEHIVETFSVLGGLDREAATAAATELLQRLGLGERLDALPREMSGGEQRRVTLARVLALRPRLIVADEPTSGLDPERRLEVLRDLVGNLPEGSACVLVTHDMGAARDFCTRAVVMLAGRIIETFDPRVERPVHPYAQMLFDPWEGPLPEQALSDEGCPFHPDCVLAAAPHLPRCRSEVPELESVDGGPRRVACHARPTQTAKVASQGGST
jgi:ABC-type glutathione transport system ATPase component